MGTKANPGPIDCYATAEPDEPLFVLKGRDKHAPTLVWLWSVLRQLDQEDPEVVQNARQIVVDMIEYQHKKGRNPVGLAQGVLAGVLELVRAANASAEKFDWKNAPTTHEFMRMVLARTTWEDETVKKKPDNSEGLS